MPPRRRTPVAAGREALATAVAAIAEGTQADRQVLATAVRYTLEELATRHPGRTLEVRVPPFGATQCLPGPTHTRGTPPNVVETDAGTWLELAVGGIDWPQALARGTVRASGQRADLSGLLPLADVPLDRE